MVYIFGSSGCNLASSPVEEVGPAPVFEAAFDGEQGVGSSLRPVVASGPLESAADDLLAGAFQDAGSDRQSELPVQVVAHLVRVGFVGADAGGDGFGPARQAPQDHGSVRPDAEDVARKRNRSGNVDRPAAVSLNMLRLRTQSNKLLIPFI